LNDGFVVIGIIEGNGDGFIVGLDEVGIIKGIDEGFMVAPFVGGTHMDPIGVPVLTTPLELQ